jgi:hypothetical protein
VLAAGWEKTVTPRFDLGATKMRCIGFAHLGCSTLQHNRAVLRKRKGYKLDAASDRGFAFFTTAPAENLGAIYFAYHLLSMATPAPTWHAALTYAVKQANDWLAFAYTKGPDKGTFPGFQIK